MRKLLLLLFMAPGTGPRCHSGLSGVSPRLTSSFTVPLASGAAAAALLGALAGLAERICHFRPVVVPPVTQVLRKTSF